MREYRATHTRIHLYLLVGNRGVISDTWPLTNSYVLPEPSDLESHAGTQPWKPKPNDHGRDEILGSVLLTHNTTWA